MNDTLSTTARFAARFELTVAYLPISQAQQRAFHFALPSGAPKLKFRGFYTPVKGLIQQMDCVLQRGCQTVPLKHPVSDGHETRRARKDLQSVSQIMKKRADDISTKS